MTATLSKPQMAGKPALNSNTVTIVVNAMPLERRELDKMLDVVVEQDVALPDSFTIRFRDTQDQRSRQQEGYFGLLTSDRFAIGAEIEVRMGRGGPSASLIKGEITSVEMEWRATGEPLLIVRGYDRAHRLHRNRKTTAFIQMMDRDIIERIARENGLSAMVDRLAVGELHEHLLQDNQTDWELLRARAAALGCELLVQDKRLIFRRPPAPEGEPPEHGLFQSLLKVRMRMAAPSQVSRVVVRGWDPKTKRSIVGVATDATPETKPKIGERKTGKRMAQPFGEGEYAITALNVSTQAEAERLARAIYDEIAGEFITLEGTCYGDPRVQAGQPISLTNLGERFSGTYYLTAVTHRLTPDEGYVTQFTAGGRQPNTLTSLLAGGASTSGAGGHRGYRALNEPSNRHPGVVVGVVTNNAPAGKDLPEHAGKVKVKFPWLSEVVESRWARIASITAGADSGFYFLPEVNDEVLIAFEHGDINRPYVIGALWNGKDAPPTGTKPVVKGAKVTQRIIKSRSGHTIILDDEQNQESITIVDKTQKNKIVFTSAPGKAQPTMLIETQGDLKIGAGGAVTVTGKSLKLEATTGDTVISGTNASLEAKAGTVTAKGVTAELIGQGTARVKGTGSTEVESGGVTSVKGALVKIN